MDERDDIQTYKVVVNHEKQYSIWPVDRDNAPGWHDAGKSGLKEDCLLYIKETWTEMSPLSLRTRMKEARLGSRQYQSQESQDKACQPTERHDLLKRLLNDVHPVELSLRPQKTTQAFKENIERGLVHIKFTKTQGGTELGVKLDSDSSHYSTSDLSKEHGSVRLEGKLTLDNVDCSCSADIEIDTLTGTARLELCNTDQSIEISRRD